MSSHTPDAELTPAKIEGMTVKVLKEELKARQLPISGLKAELVVRLHSYLESKPAAAAVTPGAPPASESEAPSQSEPTNSSSSSSSAAPMDTASEPAAGQTESISADTPAPQTDSEPKKRKLVRNTSGSSDTPSKPDVSEPEAAATPAAAAPLTVDTSAPAAKPAEADSSSVTPSGATTPSEEPAKRRILNVKRRADEKAPAAAPSPSADSNKKQKRPAVTEMATSDLVDSIMAEEKEAAEQELRLKLKEKAASKHAATSSSGDSEQKRQKSEVYDSSAQDDVSVDFNEDEEERQQPEGAQQAEEGANGAEEAEDSKGQPAEDGPGAPPTPSVANSNCIRVDGFVRPFPVPHAKELMAKQGTVEKFWMDGIRSHCYVQYASEAEAAAAVAALTNLNWPPDNKGILSAKLVTQAELTAASSAETKAVGAPKRAFIDVGANLKSPTREPKPKKLAKPVKTLDELFRKTTARPPIYYQPLTEEQAAQRVAAKKAGLPLPNFLVDPNKPKEDAKKPTTPRADSGQPPRGSSSYFLDRDRDAFRSSGSDRDRDRDRTGSDRRGRGRDEVEAQDWLSARERFQTSGEMEAELKREGQRKKPAQRSGVFGYKS